MERKELVYKTIATFSQHGRTYKINITAELSDDCKNGCHYFSVTGEMKSNGGRGRWRREAFGCLHDEISKHCKKLQPIIDLHLCNYLGERCSIDDAMFCISKRDKTLAMAKLHIAENEYSELKSAAALGDKLYFRYLLFSFGVIDRWKAEADSAIALLERLAGDTWANPYKDTPARFTIQPFTPEELESIKGKIEDGLYTLGAIKERAEKLEAEKLEAEKAKIMERYNKKVAELAQDRDIDLYVLEKLGTKGLENKIYYSHTNKLVFNWLDYKDKITQEEFIDFVNTVDYSRLPEGIQFEIK